MANKTSLSAFLFLAFAVLYISTAPTFAHRVDQGLYMEKEAVPKDEREQAIFELLQDIDANQNHLNIPEYDARFIRVIAEAMNAQHIVEVGTANGYSSIWLGLALEKTGGKLTTFEIDPVRAANARTNFKRAGMGDIITLIEGDAHETIKGLKEPIDILFLDADKKGYLDYMQKAWPLIRPGGMIIGDNITPDMVDPAFLEAITTNPELETVIRGGVSLSVKKH